MLHHMPFLPLPCTPCLAASLTSGEAAIPWEASSALKEAAMRTEECSFHCLCSLSALHFLASASWPACCYLYRGLLHLLSAMKADAEEEAGEESH